MIVFVTLSKTVVAQLLRLSFAILVWRGLLGPPPPELATLCIASSRDLACIHVSFDEIYKYSHRCQISRAWRKGLQR